MATTMEEKAQGVSEEKNDSVSATDNKSEKTERSAIQKQPPYVYGRSFLRELLSETIVGIIFWSVFQELIPAVALNVVKYRRTDYFAVTSVWFSPIFLLVPGLLNFFQSSLGLLLLRVVMVTSLASVQASSPELRLLLLAVGNFSAVLLLCSTWWHKSCHQRSTSFWGITLGFAGLMALRIWYVSINPVWATPTSNSVFIALGVLASLDRFSAVEYRMPEFKPHPEFSYSWMLMAGGFGSLLFFTQWLFGDPSVLCRWGVQGYPSTGPHPFPAGIAVFVEVMSGILLSTNQKLLTNFLWVWFVGGHMAIGVYYLSGFTSFACGLMLGPFVMSAWPEIADRVTSCPPVPTMMLTMAFYSAEIYFSMATVVPGIPYGFLFNGRAIWIIAPVILLIGRCLLKGAFRPPEEEGNTHIAFSNLDGTGAFQMFADAKIFVILILLLGTGGFARQYLTYSVERPSPTNPTTVTGLVWNSQFMLDNNGMRSHERIADFLRQSDADLIALVQSDSSRLFLGNRDTSLWLSRKLGMFDDFGPATTYHTTGVSLLTRYPIVHSEHHVVNGTDGPMVPVLAATVNVSSNLLDVVVAHLPKQRSTFDGRYYLEFITNFTRRSPNPVLLLSSLSSEPTSGDYKRLKTFGKLKDIDSSDEDRFTFSVMYKNLIRLGFARVSQAGLSEDEAQIAKFQFTTVKSYKDNEHVTIETNNVDKSALFPTSFGDYFEGAYLGEGHHYQMGTPKYFIANGN